MCVSKLTTISSDKGLSPDRRQTIVQINAAILLIGPMRINVSEILIEINTCLYKKLKLKQSSTTFCLGLNVLTGF